MDTLEGVRTWGERSVLRIEAGEMPPTGGVSARELSRFRRWLACGAPGEPLVRPQLPAGGPGSPAASAEERMEEVGDGVRVWQVDVSKAAPSVHNGLWTVETWEVDRDGASLISRERYDGRSAAIFVDEWSPPLRLIDLNRDVWQVSSERTRTDDGVTTRRSEVWSVTAADEVRSDPVEYASEIRTYLAVEDGGEEQGVSLSADGIAVQRWNLFDEDFPDPEIMSAWRVATVRLISVPSSESVLPAGMVVSRIVVEESP